MKLKHMIRRAAWGLIALVILAGCDPLKGLGEGLKNAFSHFHFP
jgi:hypothetical protein